jgi:hypothetical protein
MALFVRIIIGSSDAILKLGIIGGRRGRISRIKCLHGERVLRLVLPEPGNLLATLEKGSVRE